MPILEILKYPDPFLRSKASEVRVVDESVRALIADMKETMYRFRGIGLAATQVGADRRVIVMDVPKETPAEDEGPDGPPIEARPLNETREANPIAIVNPEIVSSSGSIVYEEGCLSLPGVTANVERCSCVSVRGLDAHGRPITVDAEGLFAIALQHEIDHLDGILFIDRVSRLKRELIKRRLKKALEAEAGAL
jgi:peptide deformylase